MNWNGNASRRNGNAAEIGYESDSSRVSRSGDVERETKRTEREPLVKQPSIPSRVPTSPVNFAID
jgi:hypothetical protein